MKSFVISALVFAAVFAAVYLMLSFVPQMQIKLAAPPLEYFKSNLEHMFWIKSGAATLFSLCFAIACGKMVAKKEDEHK